jgi:hypothetical protein
MTLLWLSDWQRLPEIILSPSIQNWKQQTSFSLTISPKKGTTTMKFSELSLSVQDAIACNLYNVNDATELTESQRVELEYLTPNEAFEAYCEWNGLIRWSGILHQVHEEIYGGSK